MRRMREDLTAHVGGSPSATQKALIERCATLSLHIELMDERRLKIGGQMTDHDSRQYLAWSNSLERDATTYDYGTKATGSSTDKTFAITNSGGVNATAIVPAALVSPFVYKGGSYPGTGGSCGSTLNATQNCTVVVTFAPGATGLQTASLNFTFNDGANSSQTSARPLQGTGASPANLTISDSTPYDFGSIATGGMMDKTFTVANTGGVPATTIAVTGLSAPFTFKGGTFPGSGGTCAATLNAGLNCTVVVTYAPTAVGTLTATMAVGYNDGVTTQSVTRGVKGTGVAPALLTVSDGPNFDYGPVVQTSTLDKTFTITNSGSLAATTITGGTLAAPFAFKGGSFPGTGGTCGSTLNASLSCTVVASFHPTTTGSFSATLSLGYYDGANSQTATRPVQGTGATAASLTISDGPTYNYGTVANGASVDKSLTITNGGGVGATSLAGSGLSAPYTFKGGSFPGTGGSCLTTLAASQTCTIVVNYNPTTIATSNQTVQVNYFDGLSAQSATRPLQGTAVAPANIVVADVTSSDFGTIATGATSDRSFTLTNSGAFTASTLGGNGFTAPFSFKGGSFPGLGGTCTTTLNASASCTVVGTFAPTATGAQSGSFNVTYFDGAFNQSVPKTVTGTGATPATLAISDADPYDYGTIANGANSDHSFTITNSGGVPATAINGSGLSTPFSFKGGNYPGTGGSCGSTLNSAQNCTVVVTFAPNTSGTVNQGLTIGYNTGASTTSVTRNVRGTGALPATITISDGPTYNFGTVAINSSNDKTLTLTNGGAFPATVMSGSNLSAPYTFKGGSYPGTGGNCATTLAAGMNCTIVVNFTPTSLGTLSATTNVNYNNGVSAVIATRDLTAVSAPAATMTISDGPTYDFGTQATGSSTDKTFTVSNTGGVNATAAVPSGLGGAYVYKNGTYPGTGGTCGTSLTASQSCTVVVTFAPSATGLQTTSLTYTFNDGATAAQTSTRAIQGTGASPALLTVSDSSPYDYGSVANGGFRDHAFTIANTGGVQAKSIAITGLIAPFGFKGGSFPGTGGNCAATLAAAGSCTVVVTFAPTNAGLQNATMSVAYNDGVQAQSTARTMQGTGVPPALLTIGDGPTYDYGPVVQTGSADHTFTVINSGSLAATSLSSTSIGTGFAFKGGGFPGTGGNCGGTLNAGVSCTMVVTFNPSATGSFSGTINLNYYDGANAQVGTRPVQGTGATAASITISDGATFSFGTVATGASVDKSFTLTNGGGVGATTIAGGSLSAPYTFKGGSFPGTGGSCVSTLAASQSCTVVVNYNPSVNSTTNQTLTVSYFDGLTAQNATRPMTGTSVAPASITVTDVTSSDFGTVATGASVDRTFTVTNAGSFAASTVGGNGLSAPFTFKGGGGFPGSGGTCTATLNAGANCTVVATFAPTATGAQSGSFNVTYFDGAFARTTAKSITGTGATPANLTLSDSDPYDYGLVANGATSDHSFTVTNAGGVPATGMSGLGLSAPFTFKGGNYPGTGGNCGTSLNAAQNCSVVVTFAPTTSGVTNQSLSVSYVNGVSSTSVTRSVRGTGAQPATISISDGPTYNFGTVAINGSYDKTLTLTNGGAFAATLMAGTGLSAPLHVQGRIVPRHRRQLFDHAGGEHGVHHRGQSFADHAGDPQRHRQRQLQQRGHDRGRDPRPDRVFGRGRDHDHQRRRDVRLRHARDGLVDRQDLHGFEHRRRERDRGVDCAVERALHLQGRQLPRRGRHVRHVLERQPELHVGGDLRADVDRTADLRADLYLQRRRDRGADLESSDPRDGGFARDPDHQRQLAVQLRFGRERRGQRTPLHHRQHRRGRRVGDRDHGRVGAVHLQGRIVPRHRRHVHHDALGVLELHGHRGVRADGRGRSERDPFAGLQRRRAGAVDHAHRDRHGREPGQPGVERRDPVRLRPGGGDRVGRSRVHGHQHRRPGRVVFDRDRLERRRSRSRADRSRARAAVADRP